MCVVARWATRHARGFSHAGGESPYSLVAQCKGKQTLRPILMSLTTGIFFWRVIDILMHVALECPITAGRVRVEPIALFYG